MSRPTFDSDGYPTEETFEVIRQWTIRSHQDANDLLKYVSEAWQYDFVIRRGENHGKPWIYTATHGWSGNESIISALQDNRVFWAMYWLESSRGGGFKFLVPRGIESGPRNELADLCEQTWNHCYPDRRPWSEIGDEAQQEWLRVFGVFVEMYGNAASGFWTPAEIKPTGPERKVLCWVVWPECGWPSPPECPPPPEPIVGWWKHGPECFSVEYIEHANHLVTHWAEIPEPNTQIAD